MPTRIEIELTSSAPDGSWTWRAAGAREPRGVLDGAILPGGAAIGDQLRVETVQDVEGIRVVSVLQGKERGGRSDLLELLPSEEPFVPVVEQRARPDRGGRRDRGEGRPRGDRRERGERGDRGDDRGDRRRGDGRGRADGSRERRRDDAGERRRQRPHVPPPPEVPQRPKPKRLRPGNQHRTEVLASLPEEQRPIAELALQGMAAVRQRLRADNARLRAEGKPEMPETAVVEMAEQLIPRLRVAEWLDRAEAAQRQLEHLDLRDLRSVVASADDPAVARDASTRELASQLKGALATKQEEELRLWLLDVEMAVDVGRVVRALRLSAMPPKAGVPFPPALARRLGEVTTASLQPTDGPDRWSAVLEAAAFSPVRSLIVPAAPAEQRSDELTATVRRLGPLLPQIAALFGVEVPPGAPTPKPLRPGPSRAEARKRPPRPKAERPARAAPEPAAERATAESPPDAPTSPAEAPAPEEPAPETPVEASAAETPVEASAAETPVEASAAETPVEASAAETPVEASAAETPVEASAAETRLEASAAETRLEASAAETGLEASAAETGLEASAAETRLEASAAETRLEASAAETRLEASAAETRLEASAAETRLEASAAETRLEASAAETRLEASAAETRLEAPADTPVEAPAPAAAEPAVKTSEPAADPPADEPPATPADDVVGEGAPPA